MLLSFFVCDSYHLSTRLCKRDDFNFPIVNFPHLVYIHTLYSVTDFWVLNLYVKYFHRIVPCYFTNFFSENINALLKNILSNILCPWRFPHKNNVRFISTSGCLLEGSCLIYVICVWLCLVVSKHIMLSICFVFLRLVASFSSLSIFDYPFSIL